MSVLVVFARFFRPIPIPKTKPTSASIKLCAPAPRKLHRANFFFPNQPRPTAQRDPTSPFSLSQRRARAERTQTHPAKPPQTTPGAKRSQTWANPAIWANSLRRHPRAKTPGSNPPASSCFMSSCFTPSPSGGSSPRAGSDFLPSSGISGVPFGGLSV